MCNTRKIIILTSVLALLVFASNSLGKEPLSELGFIKPKIRVRPPSFTLKDLSGVSRTLKEFRGKLIFLNFWATWCHPCRDEMPEMEKLWKRLKNKGFVIIAVAVDKNPRMVREFYESYKVTFPVLLDPKGEVRKKYEVTALPMTYMIGKDGKISGRVTGSINWTSDAFATKLRSICSQ